MNKRMVKAMSWLGWIACLTCLNSGTSWAADRKKCAFDDHKLSQVLPEKIYGDLGLTEKQRAQLIRIKKKNRENLKDQQSAVLSEVQAVLTPDQRKKLAQKLEDLGESI